MTKEAGSPAEETLALALNHEFPGVFQREIRVSPYRRFRWDFAAPESMIAIEVDGYRHHGLSKAGWARDYEKDRVGRDAGWTIRRYPAKQALHDPWSICDEIRALMAAKGA